jgi:transcriptional regulator with XRE-family HTH domain
MSTQNSTKNESLADLASRILEATDSTNLSEAAKKLGVKLPTLWNWAHGRTQIPNSILEKIAKEYNVSLNWLLSGEGPKHVGTDKIPPEILEIAKAAKVRTDLIAALLSYIRTEVERQIEQVREDQRFDPREEIRAGRGPDEILRDWLKCEGVKVPEDFGIVFFGWESMSDDEKIAGLESAKKTLEKRLRDNK